MRCWLDDHSMIQMLLSDFDSLDAGAAGEQWFDFGTGLKAMFNSCWRFSPCFASHVESS